MPAGSVLIADDNRDFCSVAATILRAEGYAVDECSNAETAIVSMSSKSYDAIVVEPSPSAGFLRLFELAHSRRCPSKLVVATTEDDPEFLTALHDAGVFCVARKPLSRHKLCEIVGACCAAGASDA